MKIEVFKQTHDEWYGHFTIDGDESNRLVRVFVLRYPNSTNLEKQWKVGAWGNDDYGLEKEYETLELAMADFNKIISWKFVNKQSIKDLGFENG